MDPVNTRLAAWLRALADLVDAGELPAEDVAQALFSEGTYTIDCVLSEHGENGGSEAACDLLSEIRRLHAPRGGRG